MFRRGGAAPAPSNTPKTCRLIGCRQLNGFSVRVSGRDEVAATPGHTLTARLVSKIPVGAGGGEEVGGDGWMDGIMVSQLKLPAEEC